MGVYGKMSSAGSVPNKEQQPPKPDVMTERRHDVSQQPVNSVDKLSYMPTSDEELVPLLRSLLLLSGDKPLTCRVDPGEKRALKDMVYEMDNEGFRCDINKIMRIGLNWLIVDYKKNGQESILYRTVQSLNR